MKRLLVIGKQLPRLRCIEWSELSQHNLLDYQGLLFDCRNWALISDQQTLLHDLTVFLSSGHVAYAILPGVSAFEEGFVIRFIPFVNLTVIPAKGKSLRATNALTLVQAYGQSLKSHEFVMTTTANHPGWIWTNTVTDNVNRCVCGKVRELYVFHPPSRGHEDRAFSAIIDHFQPDFIEPETPPTPSWAYQVLSDLPEFTKIQERIVAIDEDMRQLQARRTSETERQQLVSKWAELLWLDGIPLQNRVREAFDFLGFVTESQDPSGHTRDLVISIDDISFLVEVTGSARSIDVEKGRQLLQWMADAEDPSSVNGLLVGNAFRTDPPTKRPPKPDQKIFTEMLEQLAVKRHFALFDVRDLFGLVTKKLKGDPVDLKSLCGGLAVGGVVHISV